MKASFRGPQDLAIEKITEKITSNYRFEGFKDFLIIKLRETIDFWCLELDSSKNRKNSVKSTAICIDQAVKFMANCLEVKIRSQHGHLGILRESSLCRRIGCFKYLKIDKIT